MEIYNFEGAVDFTNELSYEDIRFSDELDAEEAYFESLWLEQQDEEWVDTDLFYERG